MPWKLPSFNEPEQTHRHRPNDRLGNMLRDDVALPEPAVGTGDRDGEGYAPVSERRPRLDLRELLRTRSATELELGHDGDDQPLRGDLYTPDQLARHARWLASGHEVRKGVDDAARRQRRAEGLLGRLGRNEGILESVYTLSVATAEQGERITPAAEWLVDNFYVIEQQVRLARKHLPRGYSRQLPRLRGGPGAGRPRVYDIALELIRHVDGHVDGESLQAFVRSYQSITPLTIGELWAIPIMLRLALIENLRRVAARVATSQVDVDRAAHWSRRMVHAAGRDAKSVVLLLAEMARELDNVARSRGETTLHLSGAFVSEFSRRLQGQSPAVAFAVNWVTQILAEQGQTVEAIAQAESERQAADQVSVGNSIGSLRFLEACDWKEFVESMSVVEEVLRGDPADVYQLQDFATRDEYRRAVEQIARRGGLSETLVAELVVKQARQAADGEVDEVLRMRFGHVGYALVAEGRATLERNADVRASVGQALRGLGRRAPFTLFLAGIGLATVAPTAAILGWSVATGMSTLLAVLLAVPMFIAISQIGVSITNWLVTTLAPPRPLPRLDFSGGIPADFRTAVVVPTMLASREAVDDLIDAMEVRYLANRDEHLSFVLLSDFADAPDEHLPQDEALLDYAAAQVAALNRRHGFDSDTKFMWAHRPRRWNEGEGVYMGWERKRGKLVQFNRLLLADGDASGKARTAFLRWVGEVDALRGTKYVITLDSDTGLPRDAARKLVGTMAHPLNNPIWDEALGRVVGGYGILQPRVGVTLPSAGRSIYARLLSGDPGIDPYTRAVSDVYQDAFGEGSFIGKGIYHVEMFELACADRFPENRILSHDLIEGAFARSGLVSDVTLYEDHPSSYAADMARRHRWTRGDWQIAHFLGRSFTSAGAVRGRNTLSGLSRWKIFDNLRRSLVPAAIVVTITLAWLGRPGWAWTLLLLGYFFLPALLTAVGSLVRGAVADTDLPWTMHWRDAWRMLVIGLGRAALSLAMLPYEAFKLTEAVSRTLWRLVVSRRHLLEWMTSSDAERRTGQHHGGFWRTMAAGPIYATVVAVILAATAPRDLVWLSPLLALWLISPTIAWRISTPQTRQAAPLGPADVWLMRKLARRTWTFFDTFLTAGDNYLPPDNYQEEPAAGVAHRTSPTNIGLSLLSDVAARDFGYITLGGLLHRIERTLASLERLETFGGHLFNWYDTQRLEPLSPRYVSTVDSGNFVASIDVLRISLLELIERPPITESTWRGIEDTIRLLLDTLRGREEVAGVDDSGGGGPSDRLIARLEELARDCSHRGPADLDGANLLLQRLVIGASEAVAALAQGGTEEARRWAGEFERQATWFAQELHHLCPWVDIPPVAARQWSGADTSIHANVRLVAAALERLDSYPTLREVVAITEEAAPASDAICEALERAPARPQTDLDHYTRVRRILADAGDRARSRIATIDELAARCEPFLEADFSIVYDQTRHLLHIGYNATDRRLDAAYYDLLASEQRLGSFWLVATGQLPQDHWFSLGRQLTVADGRPTLVSWSGSMFEYLMPRLLLPTYEGTLLDSSCKGAVARQIEYARQHDDVPWGISESGYNATDASLVYQYRPFGVPGLGYKRGLGEDLVIAPYATALAAMVDPQEAAINMRRLIGAGYLGRYGFFEAIDFTPNRIKRGEKEAVVRSWMAHHQGMALLSLLTVLCDAPMQRRLMSQPAMRSAELLLHERVPRLPPIFPHPGEHEGSRRPRDGPAGGTVRVFRTPHSFTPEVHLLSNGRLTTMVTAAGGGFTRHSRDGKTLAVTRWNEDATRDNWGTFIYLRDVDTAVFWSNAYQPTHRQPEQYEAIFSQARAEFRRRDRVAGGAGDAEVDIECHTQISVSPEDDVEVRRLTLINHGTTPRTIELTSYAEPVLADPRADAAHPAFGNLFVQTRLVRGRAAIIAERRARSQGERILLMIHLMAVHGAEVGQASYETDRYAFVGRGRGLMNPVAMHVERLGDSAGSVLDPVVSIRRSVRLEPGETVKVDVATGVADTNEQAHAFIERYHDRRMSERVSELAWTHAQVVLRQLSATQEDAQVYGRLAGSLIYATPQRRAPAEVIARNLQAGRRQNNLWEYGISGDLPIVLVRISDRARIDLVRQAVQAHAYWRRQGLVADLVIWNEDSSGYRNELHDAVLGAIGTAGETAWLDRSGGIFLRRADQIGDENKCLFQTVARVILSDKAGTLGEQIDRRQPPETPMPAFVPSALRPGREIPTAAEIPDRELLFHNGLGGFTPDGKEYVIVTERERPTPAPWSNVLGNPVFGTVVSEAGVGYTWHTNAREFRLTPWYNDPVSDTSGEAFYLRDEETGHVWSPTPLPATGTMLYVTRHGFGYSVFEYAQEGIASDVTLYVHRQEPAKFWLVRVRNTSDRRRRVSLTGYVEWCLGDARPVGAMHVVTSTDPRTGAVLARNPYNGEFGGRVGFFDCSEATRSVTGDRVEFLGRNGHAGAPAALRRAKLSGRVGAGLDPCAAIRTPVTLAPGEEKEIAFVLGSGNDHGQAVDLLGRMRTVAAARRALEENWQYWDRTLGTLYIDSPDRALNVLANGWLEYQVLSCRYWARSGFYQSGGAFGFRDQLQDVAALLFADATVTRGHLLMSARHQFEEGDVLHWWHPPMGKGVRTHFSDDYMWLPLVVSRYVQTTGDTGVLDEPIKFLQGPPVPPDQESVYDAFAIAEEPGSLYEHCKRAINHGIVSRGYGAHGLPLMGCGDWNDGMNLVGAQGRGESVWLAWFFITVLLDFAALADRRGDAAFGETCRGEAETLRENAEQNAWDGNWYRRAYFDNGEPLGSQSNAECQIDSLPQSWAVLSGLADGERAATAMRHVEERLVKRDAGLIQLFDPPFNTSDLEPGYIKGYLPGVRENGGQYTHAAVWTVMAYARMGDARRAWELFDLINPVNHARTPAEMAVYKVEPYVVAADVYAVEPHVGRGGWTWYTGSAGWMFRLIIESLLGLRLEIDAIGGRLHVAPLFPPDWPQFGFVYRFRDTHHHVTVIKRGDGRHVRTIKVDGTPESETFIRLREDRREHHVDVEVGS